MRHIDQHTDLIHPFHALPAEHGQPAVVIFLASIAQSIALGIGNTHLTDSKAVQDINTVQFVFDGACTLNDKYDCNLTGLFCG